jgi:hypothetical protein
MGRVRERGMGKKGEGVMRAGKETDKRGTGSKKGGMLRRGRGKKMRKVLARKETDQRGKGLE